MIAHFSIKYKKMFDLKRMYRLGDFIAIRRVGNIAMITQPLCTKEKCLMILPFTFKAHWLKINKILLAHCCLQ